MILATYQPTNPEPSKAYETDIKKKLVAYLGYNPIWCFSANSLQELIRNSILAAPNWPEEFILFEADNYTAIDVVRWNHAHWAHKNTNIGETDLLASCFEISDPRYSEYVVERIPEDNILFKMNIHDAIFNTTYSCEIDSHQSKEFEGMLSYLCSAAEHFVTESNKKTKVTGKGDLFTLRKQATLRMEKTGFEIYLLGILVGTQLPGHTFVDFMSFHGNKYFNKMPEISNLLSKNYNADEEPTYERQDQILALIDSCFYPNAPWGNKKIGRNELCPCGSGKKYKKCCLGKYH